MLASNERKRLKAIVSSYEARPLDVGLWLYGKLPSGRDNEVTRDARHLAAEHVRAVVDFRWGRDHVPVLTYDWALAFSEHHKGTPGAHVFYITKYHTVVNMADLPDTGSWQVPIGRLFNGIYRGTRTERDFNRYRRAKMRLWQDGLLLEMRAGHVKNMVADNRIFL